MSRRSPLILALLAVAIGGCGNERRPPPNLDARPSKESQRLDYPQAGLRLKLPRSFSIAESRRPGVFRATFGAAAVSAFAYRRSEELPGDSKELERARMRLVKATEERSDSFELSSSRTRTVAGNRAIELLGRQTLSQATLRTRSLHVFKGSSEYVIELLAPAKDFRRLDARVFELIASSLEITGKVRARPPS